MPHARNGNAQCHCSFRDTGWLDGTVWYHSCSCVAIGQWGFLRLATRVNLFLIENVIDLMWEEPYLNTGRPGPLWSSGKSDLVCEMGNERARKEREEGWNHPRVAVSHSHARNNTRLITTIFVWRGGLLCPLSMIGQNMVGSNSEVGSRTTFFASQIQP